MLTTSMTKLYLKEMLYALKSENLDIVIGSRYLKGAGIKRWSPLRKLISKIATVIGQWVICADLKDPVSGFFMLRRTFFEKVDGRLSGKGFKILLDICTSSPDKVRFKELPYHFGERYAGKSKLDTSVVWEHILLIAQKIFVRK